MKKTIHKISLLAVALCLVFANQSYAIVNFENGRIEIDGVQLLQDSEDENKYYYLPQYPKIATNAAGDMEFLFMKYVGGSKEENGGLFHALIEFNIPDTIITEVQQKLKSKNGKATIAGPVPMFQTEQKEGSVARFKVISSVLNDKKSDNPFTVSIETSGHAPLLKGSKAAIAAKLSQNGATLLWESMKGTTSDVSVMVSGYYEAKVQAYGAVVKADVNTIYEHFSTLDNVQKGYNRDQIRKAIDSLVQSQTISIDVIDRGQSLGINNEKMESIVEVITTQLTSLMFDANLGWAKVPKKETFIEPGQIPGRRKQSWLGRAFGRTKNIKYISDDQFVLKDIKDIRSFNFVLNLNKSTVIKVPFYTSGNIGGAFFSENQTSDNKYYRIVNLNDPDFQMRDVNFILDGNYVGAYNKVLNFISVSFLKEYPTGHFDVAEDIKFDRTRLAEKGVLPEVVKYPRLGLKAKAFNQYKYKVKYSLAGGRGEIIVPDTTTGWISTTDPDINLVPPYLKTEIIIDLDRLKIENPVSVQVKATLNGFEEKQETIILRPSDEISTNTVSVFHDKETEITCIVDWHTEGVSPKEINLKSTYLLLNPPKFKE